ncbi:hypothetical protein KP509_26G054300 [Ceratopteris richardii]|uniref:Homeobox domain-containing protein n=1 Tax=Ceratopteris richardii TaxID=49495 RepID=A0A8T2RMV0_CERRI|nr:hypothetical protein KP509_26G054300 [Ceratopteris richardii]
MEISSTAQKSKNSNAFWLFQDTTCNPMMDPIDLQDKGESMIDSGNIHNMETYDIPSGMLGSAPSLRWPAPDHVSNEEDDKLQSEDDSPAFSQGKKKRRLKSEQVTALERSFETDRKLDAERKQQLAQSLGMEPRQVAVWFQNRRARSRTKHLERDFAILRSQYNAAVIETEKLRREVGRLTAELRAATEGRDIQRTHLHPDEAAPLQKPKHQPVEISQEVSNGWAARDVIELVSVQSPAICYSASGSHGDDSGVAINSSSSPINSCEGQHDPFLPPPPPPPPPPRSNRRTNSNKSNHTYTRLKTNTCYSNLPLISAYTHFNGTSIDQLLPETQDSLTLSKAFNQYITSTAQPAVISQTFRLSNSNVRSNEYLASLTKY